MGGSRRNPAITAAIAAIASLPLAEPARAADLDQPAAPGQPIVLFSPNAPAATPPGFVRDAAATTPAKRPAAQPQRTLPGARPLIPPAAPTAKLGPPPAPRAALSLETDLLPLAPSPPANAASTNGAKRPPG
jgi:hypothetical protein